MSLQRCGFDVEGFKTTAFLPETLRLSSVCDYLLKNREVAIVPKLPADSILLRRLEIEGMHSLAKPSLPELC